MEICCSSISEEHLNTWLLSVIQEIRPFSKRFIFAACQCSPSDLLMYDLFFITLTCWRFSWNLESSMTGWEHCKQPRQSGKSPHSSGTQPSLYLFLVCVWMFLKHRSRFVWVCQLLKVCCACLWRAASWSMSANRTWGSCEHAGCVTARGSSYISVPTRTTSLSGGGLSFSESALCLSESETLCSCVNEEVYFLVIKAGVSLCAAFGKKQDVLHSAHLNF